MKKSNLVLMLLFLMFYGCDKIESRCCETGFTLPLQDMVILRNVERVEGEKRQLCKLQFIIARFNLTNPTDTPWIVFPGVNPWDVDSTSLFSQSDLYNEDGLGCVSCYFGTVICPHTTKQLSFFKGYIESKLGNFDQNIDYYEEIDAVRSAYFQSREEALDYFSHNENCRLAFYVNGKLIRYTLSNPAIICDTINNKSVSYFAYDFWTKLDCYYVR
jgi:hypothetical protein